MLPNCFPKFAAMDILLNGFESFLCKKIANVAQQLNMPAYIVGGFVRDKIIDRPTKDIDIVCVGNGIELANAVAQKFNPVPNVVVFKNFGTAQLKVKDKDGSELEIEFVGARKESYRTESRKPEVEVGTLVDDQNRRDFTINALAISLNKNDYGSLIDPFGGLSHLQKKVIKTPLEPDTTFSDDPLRMLRAIRFASQLNYKIQEPTFESIQRNAQRITIISKERIADELNKIMLSPKPSIGLDLLSQSGILQIIFPQMMALHGAENVDGYGHKDNFYHTLQVIDNICVHTKNLWLRWAALLHDIGKPPTKRFEDGHGFTFHGHEVVGAKMVPKIFAQLKLPMQENMRYVQKLVNLHLRPISLTKENITDSAIRRLLFDAGEDIDDLMLLCNADITSKNKYKVQRYLKNFELVKERMQVVEEADKLRIWQPPIKGQEIMHLFGLQPSKEVGVLKDAIKDAILDGEIANNYQEAYVYLLAKAEKLGLNPVNGTGL
jgi:putative nucleotidyltransferase with HDIG domain